MELHNHPINLFRPKIPIYFFASPKYAFTLAFYLNQKGDRDESVRMLKAIIKRYPGYKDAEVLLQKISGGKQ